MVAGLATLLGLGVLLCLGGPVFCVGDLHEPLTPQNKTVRLDQRFKYRCQVPQADLGPVVITWFHNGEEMPPRGRNYQIMKDGTLRFSKVKVINRGWYKCRVENNFRDVRESPPAYLTVHASAVVTNKQFWMQGFRAMPVGSTLQLVCEVAGIPVPTVEWRRDGQLVSTDQTNHLTSENVTEEETSQVSIRSQETSQVSIKSQETSQVSIRSILRVTVTRSATYSCSAVNYPLRKLANDSHSLVVMATANPASTSAPEGHFCAPYNGSTCRDYLRGRWVVHSIPGQQELDGQLKAHLRQLEELGLLSEGSQDKQDLCREPARRLLCHLTFPDCLNGSSTPKPVCQESCQAVESVFCFRVLAQLDNKRPVGQANLSHGLFSLPDCLSLPSKVDQVEACIDSDHHDFLPERVRDDCYLDRGRWYNGTVNQTKSGHTCQSWLARYPHEHSRFPSIFPELLGGENYCRNPGGEEDRPWCYTTSPGLRWEVCDIEACDILESEGQNDAPFVDKSDGAGEDDFKLLYIIGACVLVTVCLAVGIFAFLLHYCRRVRYSATSQDDLDFSIENLPVNSAYHQMKLRRLNPKLEALEFPRNDIVFIEDIGQGAFGRVFKARIVSGGGDSNILGLALNGTKNNLAHTKNITNPFLSKGDKHSEAVTSNHSCHSKLLGDHVSMLYDFRKAESSADESQYIAVKMLKEDASETIQADFEREASLMVEFFHPNIVRLLGVCTLGKPMCLLFEYMSRGDLNDFLRLCSPDQCLRQNSAETHSVLIESCNLALADQLHIARQVANGMIYLSERGYVHRDLATRNCLVDTNLTVKISDFGLARSIQSMDCYHGSDKDAIPVRWMPPEAILYNKFSSQSDVWSFGVLLWEIFSFALQPYYGMTHEEVINFLRAGQVMAAPDGVPSHVYELMKSCWHRKPTSRPNFVFLHKSLSFMHQDLMQHKSKSMLNV